MVERISATEAARGFSEVLNRVKYQGTSFEVERGSEVIARIVPVRAPSRVKMSEPLASLPGFRNWVKQRPKPSNRTWRLFGTRCPPWRILGVILDSNVFIRAERVRKQVDFAQWSGYGEAFISAITVSELLIGVHRATSDAQRIRRAAFVEAVLETMPVLEFTAEAARIHAEIVSSLMRQGQLIGANDLIIAATALCHGFPVLTANTSEFRRVAGLEVLALIEPEG